jgi:ABC-type antimicrobial peptide transport system permease subunit
MLEAQTVRERLLAMLAAFFATMALLLAGIGLYGVLDYSVCRRRREIGIRMALGEPSKAIARRLTFRTAAWLCAGSLAGLILGLASARYIESLLYQVKATNLRSLAIPASALLITAIAAAVVPVLRALRTDPATVLRSE